MLPKQYTVEQVAEYFHRDEQTIRRWISEGKFPHAYKVSDGWFILERDVKRLVKQLQAQVSGEMPPLPKEKAAVRSSRKGFVAGWK